MKKHLQRLKKVTCVKQVSLLAPLSFSSVCCCPHSLWHLLTRLDSHSIPQSHVLCAVVLTASGTYSHVWILTLSLSPTFCVLLSSQPLTPTHMSGFSLYPSVPRFVCCCPHSLWHLLTRLDSHSIPQSHVLCAVVLTASDTYSHVWILTLSLSPTFCVLLSSQPLTPSHMSGFSLYPSVPRSVCCGPHSLWHLVTCLDSHSIPQSHVLCAVVLTASDT